MAYQGDLQVVSQRLYPCSRCDKVAYCGVKCQRQDWKARHKHACAMRGKSKREVPKPVEESAEEEKKEGVDDGLAQGETKAEEEEEDAAGTVLSSSGAEPSEEPNKKEKKKKKKKKKKHGKPDHSEADEPGKAAASE